jgi:hypothetical protein
VVLLALALCFAATASGFTFFRHLSHPLLWHDESATAMFGRRVLEYGYPKIHGPKNALFSLWQRDGTGVAEQLDAYTGSPWAQYYLAALAVRWSDGVDDLYDKTLRVRLPFALAGAGGLLLLVFAVLPALGPRPERRLLFATLYLLGIGYSVSLLLHLREARYYGLVVLVMAAVLAVFCRRSVFEPTGARNAPHGFVLAALLVVLFLTFHAAFGATGLALGGFALARAAARSGAASERLRDLLRELAPLVAAGLAVLPLLLLFDFVDQTRGWVVRFSDPGTALRNLRFVGWTLLRYELLAPALALRLAVLLLRPRADDPPEPLQRRRIAAFLALWIAAYAGVIAQIPFLFERYFIALGPLVALMGLLDAFTLWQALRARVARPAALRAGVAGLLTAAAVALVWNLQARIPEFRGRLQELREPYRGPLDFAIPYLAVKYPDIADRVVATNYEEPALMFYLDCRVAVGFYAANLERDRELVPDVIIPRSWPEQLEVLKEMSERAPYRRTEFPVANLPWNNIPAISPRGDRQSAHRFQIQRPGGAVPALVLLELDPAFAAQQAR